MYTVRCIPPDQRTDARGLSLHEAFIRCIGLSGRSYRFTRTGGRMHLLLTNPPPHTPEFASDATNDSVAREEIKRQVLRGGLGGQFVVMTDAEYNRLLAGEHMAAE